MKFLLKIHKSGFAPDDSKAFVNLEIDEQEVDYVMQQLKFNQPFVIVLESDILCYSPSQCIEISISPIK